MEFPWETGSRDMQFIVGLGASAWSAKKAFKYNKALIKIQQDWQERMSNTAHQRQVADLRAAGLNPILSATGGSGASFGSASAPSMSVENPVEAGFSAMNMAAERKLSKQNTKTSESQQHLNEKNWDLVDEQANNAYQQGFNLMSERKQIEQNIKNSIDLTKAQVNEMNANAEANLINAHANSARSQSEVEFNRRRASGYSDSNSSTYSGGAFGVRGEYSHSHSRSW